MAPSMHGWGSTKVGLRDVPSHSSVSIPAIAWSGNGLCQVPGVRTMPFCSCVTAGLPQAETKHGSSPSGHLCSASMANTKAGGCGEQLTTPRSIPASHVPHLSHHLSETCSPEQQRCPMDGTGIKCRLGPGLCWCREAIFKRISQFPCHPFPHQTLHAADSSAEGQCPLAKQCAHAAQGTGQF